MPADRHHEHTTASPADGPAAACRRLAGGLALAVIALAGLVVGGWFAGSHALVGSGASGATMKFHTAISLMLLSGAILFLALRPGQRAARGAAFAFTTIAALLAATAGVEYALDSNIGVDEFVVSDPDTAGTDNPGRMAPQTAVSVLLLAVGITLQWASPRAAGAGRWIGAAAVIAPVVGLFQHASGISTFFTVPGVAQMALNTCLALIALVAALMLCAPTALPVAALLARTPGGAMLRRVLPAAVLIPFAGGILSVQGLRLDIYGSGVSILIVVCITAAAGAAVTWLVARHLDRVDGTRRRTEARLRANEARLGTLLEFAPVGIYEADASGARLSANERWGDAAGRPAADGRGDGWLSAVHPDDRPRVRAAWERAVRERTEVRQRFRYLHPDGTVTWVDALATPIATDTDTAWIGSELDVTARVTQEVELRGRERIATAAAGDADPAEVFAVVAEEAARTVDCDHAVVIRAEPDGDGVVVGAWSRTASATPPLGARVPIDGPGKPGFVSTIVAPVSVGGRTWGALVLGARRAGAFTPADTDRAERFAGLVALALISADAHRRLRDLATTDHLTGLPNTRAFHGRLTDEVALAQRHGRPLSLVMIDIDNFKEINDGHGHPVGDTVLRALVDRMAAQVRDGELLARVGGEEFALLMPGTDIDGARAAAERLRAAASATPIPPVGRVTLSAGIGLLRAGEGPDDLVRRADTALYAAKQGGRDLVVAHGAGIDR